MGRFINADVDVATGHGLLGNNMFAYCGNNPVNNTDSSGEDWWHWAVAAAVVVAAAVAVVATAGGATGAIVAITSVANGVSTCSTAATVAAGVFISSATALATNTYMAATESSSLEEFAAHGESAMYSTIVSGVYGGAVAYGMSRTQSPSECFVAGTLVKTADGDRPIEEIAAGDYVWAWDEATGDVALKEVIETYVNETSELIHLFVNGEEIITTPTHPFYSPVKGWTDAVNLRAGDILVLVNGEYVVVEKIQHEILESPVTVYNFNVSDYHTYFVAISGILAHNSCSSPRRSADQQALADLAKEVERDAKRGKFITFQEALILDEWALEYGVPQHHTALIGSGIHWLTGWDHTHIYNIHVPFQ